MTLQDLIPANLDMTSQERLLLIADIIDRDPTHWNQETYYTSGDSEAEPSPQVLSRAIPLDVIPCDTTMCVAGWAVALTPEHQVLRSISRLLYERDLDDEWIAAAGDALGLDDKLAHAIFYDFNTDPEHFTTILRTLALLQEPRTLENVLDAGCGLILTDDNNLGWETE